MNKNLKLPMGYIIKEDCRKRLAMISGMAVTVTGHFSFHRPGMETVKLRVLIDHPVEDNLEWSRADMMALKHMIAARWNVVDAIHVEVQGCDPDEFAICLGQIESLIMDVGASLGSPDRHVAEDVEASLQVRPARDVAECERVFEGLRDLEPSTQTVKVNGLEIICLFLPKSGLAHMRFVVAGEWFLAKCSIKDAGLVARELSNELRGLVGEEAVGFLMKFEIFMDQRHQMVALEIVGDEPSPASPAREVAADTRDAEGSFEARKVATLIELSEKLEAENVELRRRIQRALEVADEAPDEDRVPLMVAALTGGTQAPLIKAAKAIVVALKEMGADESVLVHHLSVLCQPGKGDRVDVTATYEGEQRVLTCSWEEKRRVSFKVEA